ncbi:DUF192 domain-containing protein [Halobacteriales archaeon QS_6_71_20]|nr:MAG: DUF192 domain-containing protein [Halobacteriales archaeon QS_6_71_20]
MPPDRGRPGVRVIHRPAAVEPEERALAPTKRVLADDVEVADSGLSQLLGLMFRRSVPDDYALAFRFEAADSRSLHMLFVPFAIDAVWLVEGEVTKVKRLRPWIGLGWGRADTIVELPAGAADDVEPGDAVVVEG